MRNRCSFLLVLIAASVQAEIIDRIAVRVATEVITDSEIVQEIRLTAFFNSEPVQMSAQQKRKTAERLIEQHLIRREIEVSRFPAPAPSEADAAYAQLRKKLSLDGAKLQQALAVYRLDEQELRSHVLWQLTLLRFLELRFRPAVQVPEQEIREYFERQILPKLKAADAKQEGVLEEFRDEIEAELIGKHVDREAEMWLKQTRAQTAVHVHEEAFR